MFRSRRSLGVVALLFGTVLTTHAFVSLGQPAPTQNPVTQGPVGPPVAAKPPVVADPDGQIVKSEKQTFKMEVVARDIETPWALAFLPDGRLLITERPGRLRIVEKGKLLPEPVKGTPKVWEKQDGGLFDVEVHPQYAKNGWIYLSYSEILPGYVAPATPADQPTEAAAPQGGRGRGGPPDPPTMTVIIRGKINKNNEWTDEKVLFRAPADVYSSTNAHYGSRFIFDKQNHLFFTLGEKNDPSKAQDLTTPLGKIHRINDDGSVPKDNPFVGKGNAVPSIWSYGHRNPQGLAWDPVSGKLWESEHVADRRQRTVGGQRDHLRPVPRHRSRGSVVEQGKRADVSEQSGRHGGRFLCDPSRPRPVQLSRARACPSAASRGHAERYA